MESLVKKPKTEPTDTPASPKAEPAAEAPHRQLITCPRSRKEAAELKEAAYLFAKEQLAHVKRADVAAMFPHIKTPELKRDVAREFENDVYRSLLSLKDQRPQEVSTTPVQWSYLTHTHPGSLCSSQDGSTSDGRPT
jgi:hypothetical protein